MNIGTKKLFDTFLFARAGATTAKKDPPVFPLVIGQQVELSASAVSARELIERLCFERFHGVVYFQGEDERGLLLGVGLIEGDTVTNALFSAGPTQWVGAAAWTLLCASDVPSQCLALRVETGLLQAYSALLCQTPATSTSADARRLKAAALTMRDKRATGALRVSAPDQTLLQFFHRGESLGIYTVDADGQLLRRAEGFESAPLPNRAKLEVWTREAQSLYHCLSPFDSQRTGVLACFLDTAYALGANLMPPDAVRANWCEAVAGVTRDFPWLSELGEPRLLEATPARRLATFQRAFRDVREKPADVARSAGAVVDAFLLPLARGIGEELFAAQSLRALSPADQQALREMNVASRWLRADADIVPDATPDGAATTDRVLSAVSGVRNSKATRRVRSDVSGFDF